MNRRGVAVALVIPLAAAACSGAASERKERDHDRRTAGKNAIECPLSGRGTAPKGVRPGRPAVAVKIENNPVAYPLSGLDKAEIVYEELVEGGMTRFLAVYHCTDAAKAGPIRSARMIDPAIVRPLTRILAAAGGNAFVRKELRRRDIITIDEDDADAAMRRVARGGLTLEHTLYGDTAKLRARGVKRFDSPPPAVFEFGRMKPKGRKARSFTVEFSSAAKIVYRWKNGHYRRFEDGRPFVDERSGPVTVDNVIVEEHHIVYSKGIVDTAGNPSIEIKDTTGSGRAMLFRDGRAVYGRWVRKKLASPVEFVTKSGKPMVLRRGTTWVELVPSRKGEVKGAVTVGG